MSNLPDRLSAIFEGILDEVRKNPAFAARLERVLNSEMSQGAAGKKVPGGASNPTTRRSNRRTKAAVDPFALLSAGESHLREELGKLDIEQLKDVVAEYGMDTSRLALKWKSRERLIEFIVTTVVARSRKGDVFRDSNVETPDDGLLDSGESPLSSS